MDFSFTAEEQSVLDDARGVAPVLAARAPAADRAMHFPVDDLDDLKRANLMALAVPKEYGGRGASTVSFVLACETIAAADASLSVSWVMHTACGWEIANTAPPETRAEVLADVVENGALICIAGAEGRMPDGTPCPLRVFPEGEDGWVLEGRKGFSSGSEAATYVLTGGFDPQNQHHSFVVRIDDPSITGAEFWDGMGMRASASHGLAFDHCVVPDSQHLNASYKSGDFRNTSALFGLGLAATSLGIAQAALDFTVAWHNGGKPINEPNKVRLGDMSVRVEAVRSLLWRAAWMADHDPANCEPWVDRAKTLSVETAETVALDGMRVCGGNAFRQRYSLERHLRDSAALLLQGQRPDQLRIGVANRLLEHGESSEDCHHPAVPCEPVVS